MTAPSPSKPDSAAIAPQTPPATSTQTPNTTPASLGKPRPLAQVIVRSLLSGLLYYAYYKWVIHDELKAYGHRSWSGALCMVPFVSGMAVGLLALHPAVPNGFAVSAIAGLVWIYVSQYRLYQEINRLYQAQGWTPPLVSWWLVIPGLNLWVGLRQIHFLSEYWARIGEIPVSDPVVERLSWFFSNKS